MRMLMTACSCWWPQLVHLACPTLPILYPSQLEFLLAQSVKVTPSRCKVRLSLPKVAFLTDADFSDEEISKRQHKALLYYSTNLSGM